MNFDDLDNAITRYNTFKKCQISSNELGETLNILKNDAKYDFDRLNTIIAVDLGVESNSIELIYDLHSTKLKTNARISVMLDRNSPQIQSIVGIYKSAYFDECEIFDLFGVIFNTNPNLKRLLMPKGWIGHPLRKDYEENDKRLAWNK